MGHKTITWQNETGRTVFAQAWIPDKNPAHVIILIHGLGEHSGRYEAWAQGFVKENIAVYALDTHGHGRTTGARGHTDAFGYIYDDIQHLLGTVSSDYPEAKLHLYGHSMGGAVILGFAAFRAHNADAPPVASITTTGTAIRPGFEPPEWKLKLAAWLDNIVPWLALGNELDPSWLSSDKNIVAGYNSDPLVHDRISVRWYNEWMRTIEAIRLNPEKIKSPVFMMHGAADRATSPKAAEEMARVIHAKFQSWPDAFHELHHEPCKDQVFSAIVGWIENN
jgi:alpha-beta hydrolase superfamily lysophospholipase